MARNFFFSFLSLPIERLRQCAEDGLVNEDGNKITVTDLGKIFIRNVCMVFDRYLKEKDGQNRFSRTV